jgi:hypothetical protein
MVVKEVGEGSDHDGVDGRDGGDGAGWMGRVPFDR